MSELPITPEVQFLIDEFEWTKDRHGRRVDEAAPILGLKAAALERIFYRAVKEGAVINFIGQTRT